MGTSCHWHQETLYKSIDSLLMTNMAHWMLFGTTNMVGQRMNYADLQIHAARASYSGGAPSVEYWAWSNQTPLLASATDSCQFSVPKVSERHLGNIWIVMWPGSRQMHRGVAKCTAQAPNAPRSRQKHRSVAECIALDAECTSPKAPGSRRKHRQLSRLSKSSRDL